MPDAQAEDQVVQWASPGDLDLRRQVRRGLLAHPLERREGLWLEMVEIGDVAHHATLGELLDEGIAQALNVHRAAGRIVQQSLADLGRAGGVRTVAGDFLVPAHRLGVADGTAQRHPESLSSGDPLRDNDLDHLGNDLSRLLDQDGVTLAHVLAFDLVLVVQRGARHGRPRERHGLQLGHRRQLARAAHLNHDSPDPCRRLLRRILQGNGPARELRRRARAIAQGQLVQLDDDSVDLVVEYLALARQPLEVFEHLAQIAAGPVQRIGPQSEVAHELEACLVRVRDVSVVVRQAVEKAIESDRGSHT